MTEQEKFVAAMARLKSLAGEYENVLAKEDIKEELSDMKLDDSQMELVYQYLTENRITVVNYEPVREQTDDTKEEDDRFLTMYLDELEEQEPVSEQELDAWLAAYLEGDDGRMDVIVSAMLPQVVDFAKIYKNQGLLLSDIIQEGNIGLLTGIAELKPEFSVEQAKEFLAKSICNAIEAALYEQDEALKTEEQMLRDAREVRQVIQELEEEYGRKPLIEDIAERMKKDISEIDDIMKWIS